MENNDVIELLDILYGMVTEAWGVPLGNDKCIIEREKAIEIINEIKGGDCLSNEKKPSVLKKLTEGKTNSSTPSKGAKRKEEQSK